MYVSTQSEKSATLLVASLASFLTPFMSSSINVALPSIGQDFNANAVLLSWIATSYLLAAAVFLIPSGRVADILGRKKIFLWGMMLFSVFIGKEEISPENLSQLLKAVKAAFVVFTVLCVLGVYASLVRGKVHGRVNTPD